MYLLYNLYDFFEHRTEPLRWILLALGLERNDPQLFLGSLSLSLSWVPFRTAVSLFLTPFRLRVARVRLVHPDLSALDVDIYLYHGGT